MRWLLAVAALLLTMSAPLAAAGMAKIADGGPLLVQTEPADRCRAVVCAPIEHVLVDVALPTDTGLEPVVTVSLSELVTFPEVPVHVHCSADPCQDLDPYASIADRPLLGEIEAEARAGGPTHADVAFDEVREAASQPASPLPAPAAPVRLALPWRPAPPVLVWDPAPLTPRPAPPAPPAASRPGPPAEPMGVSAAEATLGPDTLPWSSPQRAAAVVLFLLALAAYSRISSRNAALTSPVRARIHDIVQRDGVVALPKLAEELQLGRTTIEHHLRVLERCAVLTVSREGRAVLVSLPGLRAQAPPPEVRRSPACQALLAILATRPEGIARDELHKAAAEAGVPLRTRNHAIRALAQRGLVAEADGRFVATPKD